LKLREEAFHAWKSSLEIHVNRPKPSPPATRDNAVFRMIREFRLDEATPTECIYFVRDLIWG
jgi:hypothetical protein